MIRNAILSSLTLVAALLASALLVPNRLFAHCDGMDGPVVKAAQRALETGDVNAVLIWVQNNDEGAVRKAFKEALAVRKLNSEAHALADMYFFETVVRLHRAGEGAPYTGLKPAGRDLGPAIPAADRAIEDGSPVQLLILLNNTIEDGTQEQFKKVMALKNFKPDDLAAGREYVKAYVNLIHYVEQLYKLAGSRNLGHKFESDLVEAH